MWRIIAYLFPVLINMMSGGVFFICAYRFAEANYSKILVTGTMAMWAFIYSIGSLLIGRITTAKRAPAMLIAAGLLLVFSSLGFVIFPNLLLQYLWIALTGIGTAGYCTPFQVFSKDMEAGSQGGIQGVIRSTALYTAAWSLGMAIGPSVFGMLPNWQTGFYINAAMAFLMVLGVLAIMKMKNSSLPTQQLNAPTQDVIQDNPLYTLDFSRIGWVGTAFGTLTIAVVRTLEPNLAVELNIGRYHGGLILAVVSYMQVLFALIVFAAQFFTPCKHCLYSWKTILVSGIFGIIAMFLLSTQNAISSLYLSTAVYGIFSSIFYFHAVFHSQVHPTKSAQYISINEAVVGIVSVIGSIGCGVFSQAFGTCSAFAVCGIIIVVSIIVQLIMYKKLIAKNN